MLRHRPRLRLPTRTVLRSNGPCSTSRLRFERRIPAFRRLRSIRSRGNQQLLHSAETIHPPPSRHPSSPPLRRPTSINLSLLLRKPSPFPNLSPSAHLLLHRSSCPRHRRMLRLLNFDTNQVDFSLVCFLSSLVVLVLLARLPRLLPFSCFFSLNIPCTASFPSLFFSFFLLLSFWFSLFVPTRFPSSSPSFF